jgi:hypothetical protein
MRIRLQEASNLHGTRNMAGDAPMNIPFIISMIGCVRKLPAYRVTMFLDDLGKRMQVLLQLEQSPEPAARKDG